MFGHMFNLYDELMKPGTRIPVLAPADKKSVINIYVDGQLARAITIDPWKADHITGENQWELSPPQFYQLTSPDLEMN